MKTAHSYVRILVKAPKINKKTEDDMADEYDFSGGIRGKYAKRFAEGTNLVVLSPDVAKAFPDSASVNRTLRLLLKLARQETHVS